MNIVKVFLSCFSPVEIRVLFPVTGIDWSECVQEMCPKYRKVMMIVFHFVEILMMMSITGEPRLPPSPPWPSWRS